MHNVSGKNGLIRGAESVARAKVVY